MDCTAGSSCCGIKVQKEEHNMYKGLFEMYEKDDSNNILTSRGQNILCTAKKVAIYLIAAYALLTLVSVKKTLDNIEGRVHNASSVNTKK